MSDPGPAGLAGVALAAGRGERLRPLSDVAPKPLMPVNGIALLEGALTRLTTQVPAGPGHLAVNAHHLSDQIIAHVAGRAHVSVEHPEALGTAGALARLRTWLDGRDVLLTNADVYQPWVPDDLVTGWDGQRCRLLVTPVAPGSRVDFHLSDGTPVRYLGSCLLPWTEIRDLTEVPSGLYEVLWRDLDADGRLDFARTDLTPERPCIDCGTPADYLRANLHASGGRAVVGRTAEVHGRLDRCVVWDGAYVGPDESLREVIRAGTRAHPLTVAAGSGATSVEECAPH